MTDIPQAGFEELMHAAQKEHALFDYREAMGLWARAAHPSIAPTPLDEGRALRGLAVSMHREGEGFNQNEHLRARAQVVARNVFVDHAALLPESGRPRELWPVARECLESGRVAGRIALKNALRAELRTGRRDTAGLAAARAIFGAAARFGMLDRNYAQIPLDQHDINFFPVAAIGDVLTRPTSYFDPESRVRIAGAMAKKAWLTALKAESSSIQNPADLGRRHQAVAVVKAVYRAGAATAINWLAAPEGGRRKWAVRLAMLPGVL